MNTISEHYIKGFNHAFLLAKFKPELIKSIVSTKSRTLYILGLQDGKHSYEKSRVKSRSQELSNIRSRKNKNRDKGLER